MKAVHWGLMLLFLLLTGLWLLADTLMPQPFTYFNFRNVFVQYSGILGFAAMSTANILAYRPRWLEPYLHGLDKMYRLHKWLGISGLSAAVVHWWWAQGSKWMVGWGWLAPPVRHKGGMMPSTDTLEGWLLSQRGFAEHIGEWAFYVFALLAIIALVKHVPYRWFQWSHRFMAAVYLVFVYHFLVLFKWAYWTQPIGWLMILLALGGTYGALVSLFGRIGHKRKAKGTISEIKQNNDMAAITVHLNEAWQEHQAGQFAFITFDNKEGAHPFTIASARNNKLSELCFIIKNLGDYTANLLKTVQIGKTVSVEGPYGCFDFNDGCTEQIWIGAGIGITPFLARLAQLAHEPQPQKITLFYCARQADDIVLPTLQPLAAAAGVSLHFIDDSQNQRLSAADITQLIPTWQQAGFWFCGPMAFGQQLYSELHRLGLPNKRFQQEWFEMR